MCHSHCRCDAVASFGFSSLAESDEHVGVGNGFIGIIVVDQKSLLEVAVVAVVSLIKRNKNDKTFSFIDSFSFLKNLVVYLFIYVFIEGLWWGGWIHVGEYLY